MTATDPPTEQQPPARRVSRQADQDREIREQRRDLIATMLLSRIPYRQMVEVIRENLGIEVSTGTIASDVAVLRRRWGARMTEAFGSHVSEQMAYYDGLLRALTPGALRGEHDKVQDLLAVLDRRAKLVGMDQPDKVLVGAVVHTDDVAARWAGAPPEEQAARTEQIMAILTEAGALRLPGGPPLQNGDQPVIDIPDPTTNGDH